MAAAISRFKLRCSGEDFGAFGMHHDRKAGACDQLKGAKLVRLIRPGQPGKFDLAVRRGRGGEYLEGDDATVSQRVNGNLGQRKWRTVEPEINMGRGRKMVAPQDNLFGRVAAGVGDRHLENSRYTTCRTSAGFRRDGSALRISGRADVTVNINQAGQDVLTGRIDCLRRLDAVISSGDTCNLAARHQQRAVEQAIRGNNHPPGDGQIDAHFSPSSVSACPTPSRWVRCIDV